MRWLRTRIKICGVTNKDDLLLCQKFGADAIGFVLHKKSPRYIPPEELKRLLDLVYPWVSSVAVLTVMDLDLMDQLADWGISTFQIYFDMDEGEIRRFKRGVKIIRAVNLAEVERININLYDGILLDAQDAERLGGTGKVIDWERAKDVVSKLTVPVILAGGLNPTNVYEAIKTVRPYGVDVASGLEKEMGRKDEEKVLGFVNAVFRASFDLRG